MVLLEVAIRGWVQHVMCPVQCYSIGPAANRNICCSSPGRQHAQ